MSTDAVAMAAVWLSSADVEMWFGVPKMTVFSGYFLVVDVAQPECIRTGANTQ